MIIAFFAFNYVPLFMYIHILSLHIIIDFFYTHIFLFYEIFWQRLSSF